MQQSMVTSRLYYTWNYIKEQGLLRDEAVLLYASHDRMLMRKENKLFCKKKKLWIYV